MLASRAPLGLLGPGLAVAGHVEHEFLLSTRTWSLLSFGFDCLRAVTGTFSRWS
jgi:hypothetical protein